MLWKSETGLVQMAQQGLHVVLVVMGMDGGQTRFSDAVKTGTENMLHHRFLLVLLSQFLSFYVAIIMIFLNLCCYMCTTIHSYAIFQYIFVFL